MEKSKNDIGWNNRSLRFLSIIPVTVSDFHSSIDILSLYDDVDEAEEDVKLPELLVEVEVPEFSLLKSKQINNQPLVYHSFRFA